jgi:hypothetical protein
MMSRLIQIVIIISITLTSNGCASKSLAPSGWGGTQIKLSPTFWENKSSRILIGVTPYPIEGHTYNLRSYFGVRNVRITDSLDSGLTNYVQNYDYSEILKVKSAFAEELINRGMHVLLLDDKALETQYHHLIKNNANSESVKTFKGQNNVDYVLLFQITRYGLINKGDLWSEYRLRSIGGVVAYLLDLNTGNIEWKCLFDRNEVSVAGEWNQPPNYPNVTTAIQDLTVLITTRLNESFFK